MQIPPQRPGPPGRLIYECDHTHPDIVNASQNLRQRDDWGTARAVYDFVSSLPFRFGEWHRRASETLAKKAGSTTTKANLTVALFRALGMDARFASIEVPANFYAPLMRPELRVNRSNASPYTHHFAVVKVRGQWIPCDTSFCKIAMHLMAYSRPAYKVLTRQGFLDGHGFTLYHAIDPEPQTLAFNKDLEDFDMNLDPEHVDMLNELLDEARY